jgi:iron complex outermembrane receptor protein
LKVNVTRDSSDSPNPLQYSSCPQGTGPSVLGVPFIAGARDDCKLNRNVLLVGMDPAAFPGIRNGGDPFTRIKQRFGVLDVTYNLSPDIIASSTTTYYKNNTDTLINGTYSGASLAIYADNVFSRRDFTQEIRIQSDAQGAPLNWMVGGYYQDARMKINTYIGWNQTLNPIIQPIFGFGFPPLLAGAIHDVDIESKSLFGQLRWRPVETLEIAGGVRWTDERRSNDAQVLNPGATASYFPITQPKIGSKNWSPELTVTYTPTDDLTIFGALKQGYKSGSFSILSIPTDGEGGYGDEKVQGGEVGLKARLLDRALNVNAAFYYYRFSGLQIGVSEPAGANNVPIVRTLNAGKAKTYGIDFDATYQPPDFAGLSLNLAVNWNKARFVELTNLPCYGGQTIAAGCDQQLNPVTGLYTARDESGTPLERAPEWQMIGGFDYDTELTDSLGLAFGSSAQHSSSYITPIGSRSDFKQKGFTKINAYITLKGKDDRWELSLIGNNLNDVIRCGYCANSDFQNTTLLTALAQTTGGVSNVGPFGVAHIDEVGGIAIPGRQVVLKLTLRPIGLFQ